MCYQFLTPKTFLCRYPLSLGAVVFGIFMILVNITCIIVTTVEMLSFAKCKAPGTHSVMRSAHGFSATTIIYSIIMIMVHLWFIWGVRKSKASVVLVWVVVTSMWVMQTACLILVLLCMYMPETSFAAWILSVVFGLIAFAICLYGVLVGYGLWFEMKTSQRLTAQASGNQ